MSVIYEFRYEWDARSGSRKPLPPGDYFATVSSVQMNEAGDLLVVIEFDEESK